MDRPGRKGPTELPAATADDDASVVKRDRSGNESASDDSIARRAYQRFEERGREHGHDVDDWLEAERELTGRKGE